MKFVMNKKVKCCSKVKVKHIFVSILCVLILDYFGAFTHMFEVDFFDNFSYPYSGDVSTYVEQLKQGVRPQLEPINVYNQTFLYNNSKKCSSYESVRLVYIVKSAVSNFARRQAIRSTWGYERRFSDVIIKTVFVLGTTNSQDQHQQLVIQREIDKFKDIIQVDFIDSYFNNTIKTMNGMKWAVTYCSNADFYFFSDDDMYVSTKNVLRFLRYPTRYPQYLEEPVISGVVTGGKKLLQVLDFELDKDVKLLTGYVFFSSPHRHKTSKWYVSLSEYPYHMWPPYVTAGSFILSKQALLHLYYTSFYTQHFRFDDIFLGLVAMKAGIEPFHCSQFNFYKKQVNGDNYKYVISSHGYDDPEELIQVWSEQKAAGYA